MEMPSQGQQVLSLERETPCPNLAKKQDSNHSHCTINYEIEGQQWFKFTFSLVLLWTRCFLGPKIKITTPRSYYLHLKTAGLESLAPPSRLE